MVWSPEGVPVPHDDVIVLSPAQCASVMDSVFPLGGSRPFSGWTRWVMRALPLFTDKCNVCVVSRSLQLPFLCKGQARVISAK